MREISSDTKKPATWPVSLFTVPRNHQSPRVMTTIKPSKPSRKDTQKLSLAGGVVNVCKNHQLHVRDDTCSETLISPARVLFSLFYESENSNQPRARYCSENPPTGIVSARAQRQGARTPTDYGGLDCRRTSSRHQWRPRFGLR